MLSLLPALLLATAPAAVEMPRAADVLRSTRRVADWQLAHADRFDYMPAARASVRNPRDWQQATFWVALTELADRDATYRKPILALGAREQWQLGRNPYHADDQLIAQAWEWASRNGAGPAALAPARAYFDRILADRRTGSLAFVPRGPGSGDSACTDRWCWCDALFMAPPTLLRLGQALRDPRYAAFVHDEFKATTDYLYDPGEKLFFRDSRFFDRRDGKGNKLFWSRGNGWVLAGLARVIQGLPKDDPRRSWYVGLFRDMAGRIVTLQKPDGYWAPSLLDNGADTPPESSGTGFFTYAFAWGIRAGILDPVRYRAPAIRGWRALERAVQPSGMLGWVQQVSDRPDVVAAADTQFYGAGAYVLAGTAIHDLARAEQERRR
ncbi:glycoside hydrolase family 105 protein [Sphingomonas sp. S2-65]|uniref:glycoside hydrolase family 88/105 protein n=1 Tax=Sphingomonas sp. S2-65 TaxID=2903960 RepID=UPI001F430D0C|nr:glycoside hydrolase family 88 protein [Sphingomonas sp. S2-65]UYY60054.1 glycoside hydrolase family 88 protein [Sphingomonas sp. S2-65]